MPNGTHCWKHDIWYPPLGECPRDFLLQFGFSEPGCTPGMRALFHQPSGYRTAQKTQLLTFDNSRPIPDPIRETFLNIFAGSVVRRSHGSTV